MVLSRLSLHKHIRRLKDPRLNRRKRHLLGDILTLAVCAVIAGPNTPTRINTAPSPSAVMPAGLSLRRSGAKNDLPSAAPTAKIEGRGFFARPGRFGE